MEYRFTLTMETLEPGGTLEEKMERLLDAFSETHPEVGPVVGGDSDNGTIDVTFSLSADDISKATEGAVDVINAGLKAFAKEGFATGIQIHGTAIPAEDAESAKPESLLQPA
jgi:hypothetical protein